MKSLRLLSGNSSMRYYLDLPLVVGYALMATIACLGMLQLVAARGEYRGLSLFATRPRNGKRIGVALVIAAILGYVLFAPEILTPGPAGSEVAFMFTLCALTAFSFTLVGADMRIRRQNARLPGAGQKLSLGDLTATLYCPPPPQKIHGTGATDRIPPIILLPDPSGFVVLPAPAIDAFTQAGMAVLLVDISATSHSGSPPLRHSLAKRTSDAVHLLSTIPGVDTERVGLLGMGLSGDGTLATVPGDPKFAAAIALAPLLSAPLRPGETARGLHWLRELSYTQAWRWQRLWPRLHQAAKRLHSDAQTRDIVPVLRTNRRNKLVAIRNCDGAFEILDTPDERYFALLAEDSVEKRVVRWFRDALVDDCKPLDYVN